MEAKFYNTSPFTFVRSVFMSVEETISLKVDHSTEIADDIAILFKTKDFSDITLIVGDTRFLCHRVILASRCEYFRALLFGGLSETNSSSIHLNGISSTAFSHVLEYIYTGKLDITGVTVGFLFYYNTFNIVCILFYNNRISFTRFR